jgi:hypothetical protein
MVRWLLVRFCFPPCVGYLSPSFWGCSTTHKKRSARFWASRNCFWWSCATWVVCVWRPALAGQWRNGQNCADYTVSIRRGEVLTVSAQKLVVPGPLRGPELPIWGPQSHSRVVSGGSLIIYAVSPASPQSSMSWRPDVFKSQVQVL